MELVHLRIKSPNIFFNIMSCDLLIVTLNVALRTAHVRDLV
jgi:hypothetical protein